MKYRKKPVIIEAIQLTPETIMAVYCFTKNSDVRRFREHLVNAPEIEKRKWSDYENEVSLNGMDINTLEGTMKASLGDYIIKKLLFQTLYI